MMSVDVKENIEAISKTLPPGVTLVAVSKTKSNDLIMAAYEAGQRDFGENYVQELVDKHEALPKDIRWHFIGHLQTNKIKYIAPFVHLIHGVDSLKLLIAINKQAERSKRVIDCLLQIFIAKEETKFGLSYEECEDMLNSAEFQDLKHVKIAGLMAMGSNTDNEEQLREEFSKLKLFYDRISENVLPLTFLSVGMSSDYKIALEQGSNMIRLGSTIFGSRIYQ